MDTAKVDIRKLQLLNDRINQCIDALNQVRLSVHGLSHSTQPVPGMGTIGSFAQNPAIGLGYGSPATPFVPGLPQTSPFAGQPQAWNPGAMQGLPGTFNPYAAQSPYGLSHTTGEEFGGLPRPVWADPQLVARIVQTFPYVYVALPPVVPIY